MSFNPSTGLLTVTGVASAFTGNLTGNVSGTAAGLSATLVPASGGTGVANNNASTITISGNFASTFTVSGAYNYTYPAATSTLAALGVAQTWTAVQTFTNSDIKLLGSSTGKTIFTSANAGASDYTITFPAVTDTVAVLGANTFTGAQILSDQQVSRAMMLDCGNTVVDKGNISAATVTFDYSAGSVQTYTATGSTVTWATSNWPPTGNMGYLHLFATNAGNFTHSITGITWLKPDGTTTTTFSTYLAANTGRTALQTAGVDEFLLWSRDAGTTIYGKLI
jgi:hypothetical protein